MQKYNNYDVIKLDSSICDDDIKNDIPKNCSEYTIESIIKDSCIICNLEQGYYPIYNKSNNFLKKCYKDLEGYYYILYVFSALDYREFDLWSNYQKEINLNKDFIIILRFILI